MDTAIGACNMENIITDYWLNNYVSSNGLCSLCANLGEIDTRGIRTAANIRCGRINYCICPNGQQLRESEKEIS